MVIENGKESVMEGMDSKGERRAMIYTNKKSIEKDDMEGTVRGLAVSTGSTIELREYALVEEKTTYFLPDSMRN
jgi:hypothetical protein